MTSYFHVAPNLLAIGSVILPGNWGRIIKLYKPNNSNLILLYRETMLEHIRATEFPDKPSRLESLFLLPSLDEARRYQQGNAQSGVIYEVQVDANAFDAHYGSYSFHLPPTLPIHGGGQLALPSVLDVEGYYAGMPKIARSYWGEAPTKDVEIVARTQATIVAVHQ